MTDDAELLRRYSDTRSEAAFAELVHRHMGWIYRSALRRVGGRSDWAQDITQYVFIAMAKQSSALVRHDHLAGWCYTTIRNAASRLVRSESSRRRYETESAMNIPQAMPAEEELFLRPLLDQELDRLPKKDRQTLILRFFEQKTFGQIARELNVSEDGARKRADRALERLATRFQRRGVISSAGVLTRLLTNEGSAAAPATMAAEVLHLALAGTGSVLSTGSNATLIYLLGEAKFTGVAGTALSLVGLAAVSAVIFTMQEVSALRHARARSTANAAQIVAEQDRLRATEAATGAIEAQAVVLRQQVAAFQQQAQRDQAARKQQARDAAARAEKARRDAREFLAESSQARTDLFQFLKLHAAADDALYARRAGWTPAQVDAFATQRASYFLSQFELTPQLIYAGQGTSFPELPDDRLEAILGADGARGYKAAQNARTTDGWLGMVLTRAAEASAPIALNQVLSMEQALTRHSPEYAAGRPADLAHVDWDAALQEIQLLLNPGQWNQIQPAILQAEVRRRFSAAAAAPDQP